MSLKACEICGTNVVPPFHSFCSHDCIDVFAGRKPAPVQLHTDGHGMSIPSVRSRPDLWMKDPRWTPHAEDPTGTLLSAQWLTATDGEGSIMWYGAADRSWYRIGGRQERAYADASRRSRESGRGGMEVWKERGPSDAARRGAWKQGRVDA